MSLNVIKVLNVKKKKKKKMVLNVIKVLNVLKNGPKCNKGPKYNADFGSKCNTKLVLNVINVLNVIKFGPKYNKSLVLKVINPLLHLGANVEASNVITDPKCNKEPKWVPPKWRQKTGSLLNVT